MLPFQAWELHLPHPCQQPHPTAPRPDPADEVSALWGSGETQWSQATWGRGLGTDANSACSLLNWPCDPGHLTPAISPRPSLGLFLICKTGGRLTGAVRIVRDGGWEMVYSGLGP